MNKFATFTPLLPNKPQDIKDYYKQNNIAIPQNSYFDEYLAIDSISDLEPETSTFKYTPAFFNLPYTVKKPKINVPLREENSSMQEKVSIIIGAKNSIADRHNNPWNLMYVGQEGAKKGEAKKGGGNWARFDTTKSAEKAYYADLDAKIKGNTTTGLTGDSTLADYINVYAPAFENDTSSYVNMIIKNSKMKLNTPLKNVNRKQLAKIMARIESSTIIP